ncbi:MAG: acyloxyacyl hydrolase [Planctomycetota bacterium]|nr:acyloxyacyl hydrolase [Planctomycetota bacterium]MDW8372257.1 acyloxyacyl hydrolase [Planctomycetota bacterium]
MRALLAWVLLGVVLAADDAWGARLTFSAPTVRIGDFADEGNPYRASLGLGHWLRSDLSAWADAVASYIDVNDFIGAAGGTAYALGVDLSLRWTRGWRDRVALYLEGGAGAQNSFPISFVASGTHFNFTVLAGAGLEGPSLAGWTPSAGLRYLHLSNANLLPHNHGYDGVSALVGVQRRW